VEQARLLHARGVSLRRLALMLDVPRSTLARALRR
jgi:lambda repressor-like predicted transcriptional regulator